MLVRKMLPADASAVGLIHTRAWQYAYRGIISQAFLNGISVEKRSENWRKSLEEDGTLIRLVAEDEGKVTAFACGLENRKVDLLPECDCELWAIYCAPEEMGRGYGRALVEAFRAEMRALGKERLCVWALKENRVARGFYERQGGVLHPREHEIRIGEQALPEVAYVW